MQYYCNNQGDYPHDRIFHNLQKINCFLAKSNKAKCMVIVSVDGKCNCGDLDGQAFLCCHSTCWMKFERNNEENNLKIAINIGEILIKIQKYYVDKNQNEIPKSYKLLYAVYHFLFF